MSYSIDSKQIINGTNSKHMPKNYSMNSKEMSTSTSNKQMIKNE